MALKAVHDDLFFVRLLGQMQDEMAGLIGRMKSQYEERVFPSPGQLMKALIGLLKQQYISESHFRGVVEQTGLRQIAARIDFLREWNKNVKRLPLKMYARQDQREKMLGAGQIALDALVAEEEEGAEW